jgi:hypothetical protein
MMKYIFLILVLAFNLHATDAKFFTALHQVETSGRTGAIRGDQGRSLGPYQISKAYWLDATYRSPSLRAQGYGSVSRIDYSRRIVVLYCQRYEPTAVKAKNYETLARLHNAGPRWSKKKHLTHGYWRKFEKRLR